VTVISAAERARRWLEQRGVRRHADGHWEGQSPSGEQSVASANDVAHQWTDQIWLDGAIGPLEQLDLALGLLDLLDEYWVTVEVGQYAISRGSPVLNRMWEGYRERLERPTPAEQVTYSLWVDWFEDRATVESAFSEVLSADVLEHAALGRLSEFASGALHRRSERVLEASGPVPWTVKIPIYEHLERVPELHPALFRAVLASYHDIYGSLEADSALHLLDRLELPTKPAHYGRLRAVLLAGHTNHYRSPEAWDGPDRT
jgi:hypothetical protein